MITIRRKEKKVAIRPLSKVEYGEFFVFVDDDELFFMLSSSKGVFVSLKDGVMIDVSDYADEDVMLVDVEVTYREATYTEEEV